ncbi:uncharacterized protein LOC116303865 [Actinia tenebrosa]|uniref:Uncharacterized protein LOC116303865 n=1 Tax=Actinia tenebrosa TaxID=6105 RepID=A0A6P8ISR2_ACTTE|nr:uncharacterized protein LOC116303865 [Actinia tenebrosa]
MSGVCGFSVEHSWGVGSVRQCAGFPGNILFDDQVEKIYCVPLGPQIVCWDIEKKERKICFQGHSDLIICLQYNHSYGVVLTISYSGEIKLWNEDFKLLLSEKTGFGNAHYGVWSNDGQRFLICGGPWKFSLLTVYELSKASDGRFNFSTVWQNVGVAAATLDGSTNSISDVDNKEDIREQENNASITYIKQNDNYIISQFSSKDTVLAIFERYHGNASEVHLFDANGAMIHSNILDPLDNPKAAIMCTTPCHNGAFAVGFQGGVFEVLNEEDLTMKSVFQATGSPQVALWDKDYILAVSYLSGVLSWWTTEGVCVHELKGGPKDSNIHVNWVSTSSHNALWIAGIMALNYVELMYTNEGDFFPSSIRQKYSLRYHEVTGCGFDLSNSNLTASGDFVGNVFVWEKGKNEPLYRTKQETAIRSLVWKNDKLFIGCLDGLIIQWTPSNAEFPVVCLACTSGVLSLRWSHNKLAIGLENGDLLLYTFTDEEYSDPVRIINQKAHSQTKDGALLPAEIWSVCWSPCGKMIATASEDQTTCIWNASNGNKLRTLHGHTTAVTSVDWKTMRDNSKNILATCGDDRTVQIMDGISFDIIHTLKLHNIEGWFTLTYLSLNPHDQKCLCSTQNGHLALWDCSTGNLLACHKMHCGSIEGLAWSQDFSEFGTVSSDCVVNIFHIKDH